MPEGFVLPDFHYHSRHHGHYLVAPRMEVDSVVKLSFSGKRVFPIPIKRVDFHPAQRIAYAKIAFYPYVLAGVGRQCRGSVS